MQRVQFVAAKAGVTGHCRHESVMPGMVCQVVVLSCSARDLCNGFSHTRTLDRRMKTDGGIIQLILPTEASSDRGRGRKHQPNLLFQGHSPF